MDWNECLKRRIVKRREVDDDLIKSLLEISDDKLKVNEFLPLNETTASSKLCLVYDSFREVLEAVAVRRGYKVYNHECYVGFLKEVLKMEEMACDFDKVRKIRNAISYYGKRFGVDFIEENVIDIIKLRKKIVKLVA